MQHLHNKPLTRFVPGLIIIVLLWWAFPPSKVEVKIICGLVVLLVIGLITAEVVSKKNRDRKNKKEIG
ncbi:MAG: hypothetical protein Q8N59_00945 [bacterium]|nr:hypothetical protein [bacterium]